jgi:hypothetical protein
VTWAGVTNFSPFSLGVAFGSQSPLPVMFYDVKAYQKSGGVQVEWSNLTERELIKYAVERSSNGVNFATINEQAPRSNNNDKESYSFFDASPFAGENYYRIKVYELSGKIIYSKVLKVDLGRKQASFNLYPNPVEGGQLSVSTNLAPGQYTLAILNATGLQIHAQKITHPGGSMTQAITLPFSAKPGVYNMVISGGTYRGSKTFVIQ